jgi:proteasome regulatory subunit
MNLDSSIDLREIALKTDGRNGADLRAITMEAGMFAIRSDHERVTREDLLKAIDKFSGELERGTGVGAASAMFA